MKSQFTLGILCIVFLIGCIISIEKCVSENRKNNNQANVANIIMNDSTTYYKDQYNREHAQRQQVETDLATAKVYYGKLIDSVSSALKIKSKDIKSITTASLVDSGNVDLKVDTVSENGKTKLVFGSSDRWFNIKGTIGDNSTLAYTVYDSIIITSYIKKTGFLGMGRPITYINGYSINPHTKVTGISNLQIESSKVKKFSLGVGVGYGFNGSRIEPMIGLSLHYSLISF